jgi:hypothetical protein
MADERTQHQWNDNWQGKPKVKRNHTATSFTTYSTRTALGYQIKIQAQTICVVTRERKNPE